MGGGMMNMDNHEIPLPKTQGIYKLTWTLQDGTPIRYTLSIPGKISSTKTVPLVLALHFGGTVTPWYSHRFLNMLVEPALRELDAIILAPDCPGKGWDNFFSGAAAMELLEYIKGKYPVDSDQIIVTGFSLGGMGTWYMAAKYPQVFAAAIPISGTPTVTVADAIGSIPLYVIHSTGDEIFPLKPLEDTINKLKKRGCSIEMVILDGISHYHTGRFIEPLHNTIPWIKKIFKNQKKN